MTHIPSQWQWHFLTLYITFNEGSLYLNHHHYHIIIWRFPNQCWISNSELVRSNIPASHRFIRHNFQESANSWIRLSQRSDDHRKYQMLGRENSKCNLPFCTTWIVEEHELSQIFSWLIIDSSATVVVLLTAGTVWPSHPAKLHWLWNCRITQLWETNSFKKPASHLDLFRLLRWIR